MPEKIIGSIRTSAPEKQAEPGKPAPLALGFRPFFLLAIWFAVLLMAASLTGFITAIKPANYFEPNLWHGHEMVFGFSVAVVAGFLLTSVRNWTNLPTPTGAALGWLALLWLAPRLLSFVTILPPVGFALLDMLFLPVLAVILSRPLWQLRQQHNYPIPALLLLLALCNAAVHLEVLGVFRDISTQAMQIAVLAIIALISVIAGRVLPFFMQRGINVRAVSRKRIEQLALPSILLLAACIALNLTWAAIAAALLAALLHTIRLSGWLDRAIVREPMLWVLHTGYAWLIAGFLIYALSLAINIPVAQAVHAWTLGAIGMFSLGMMARVALGHTGRSITALPGMMPAFALIFLAALIRVMLPIIQPDALETAVVLSAALWMSAFGIAGLRYTFILLRARADGKPG